MGRFRVVILNLLSREKRYIEEGDVITFGRASSATIVIENPFISRSHIRVAARRRDSNGELPSCTIEALGANAVQYQLTEDDAQEQVKTLKKNDNPVSLDKPFLLTFPAKHPYAPSRYSVTFSEDAGSSSNMLDESLSLDPVLSPDSVKITNVQRRENVKRPSSVLHEDVTGEDGETAEENGKQVNKRIKLEHREHHGAPTDREGENHDAKATASSSNSKPQVELTDLEDDISCGICAGTLFNASTCLPCSHTFCLGCIKEWRTRNNICPVCRVAVRKITPNFSLRTVVEAVISKEPRLQRSTLDVERLRAAEMLSDPEGEADCYSSEEYDGDSDEDIGRECLHCLGQLTHYRCSPSGRHYSCHACHRKFPVRPEREASQRCNLCLVPYCLQYYREEGAEERTLQPSLETALATVENGLRAISRIAAPALVNEYERDVFRRYLSLKGLSVPDVLGIALQRNVFRINDVSNAAQDAGSAGAASGDDSNDIAVERGMNRPSEQEDRQRFITVEDICRLRGNLSRQGTAMAPSEVFHIEGLYCSQCISIIAQALLFRYRLSLDKSELPEFDRDRPFCWYGINCRTQHHNAHHARKLDHICFATR